jgi:tetratricopeptide (TPR) repeat protein
MSAHRSGLAGWGIVIVGILLAAGVLRASEQRRLMTPQTQRLLYLRSGAAADRVMLAFDDLAADIYWIRAIQNYGRDRRSSRPDRFSLLYPLLDLTTTLDARFNVAYRFGAIFLSVPLPNGPGRPDLAIALLEKGLRHNPRRWQYAHDIGFIHYWYTGDDEQAARWFERAAGMPDAPEWIAPIAAVTRARGGDRAGARRILEELRQAASEQYTRDAAERGLLQLQALDAIDELQALVDGFHQRHGRYPSSWRDLPELRGLVPADATGAPFVYNPSTHQVQLSPDSSLKPLPVRLNRS